MKDTHIDFELDHLVSLLARTPDVLRSWLTGLPGPWVQNNEGEDTWSPFDVIGHLIHGEKTDWIPRAGIILDEGGDKRFEDFDRFAQFHESEGKSLVDLLHEFEDLRRQNLRSLQEMDIDETTLGKKGIHPEFGEVTLKQLLAAWLAHDMTHIAQVARVMAHQYREDVGPWSKYMRVLQ